LDTGSIRFIDCTVSVMNTFGQSYSSIKVLFEYKSIHEYRLQCTKRNKKTKQNY
jgi:hypothetical protein